MMEIKATVFKRDSHDAVDTILAFCVAAGETPIPFQRGIRDKADSHLTEVWMKITAEIDDKSLRKILEAKFTVHAFSIS